MVQDKSEVGSLPLLPPPHPASCRHRTARPCHPKPVAPRPSTAPSQPPPSSTSKQSSGKFSFLISLTL